MLYAVGADENTPVKKITNAGGKTTLAQDPSNRYSGRNLNPQPTSTKSSSTGTKASSSSGGGGTTTTPVNTGGGGGGFDYAAYLASLEAQRRAAAQAAYDRNMSRIRSGYESAYGSLRGNYDSTVSRLNAARDKSMGDVNSDAENSLRQAYINNMLTRRNLNQRLSAMGYNGGATESTMASLENQYGNSRTGINETLNKNIADLNMTYGDNLAQALQSFNSAKANLDLQRMQMEMQAENALNSAVESSMSSAYSLDGSYLSALQSALTNQANYQYNPSVATNDFVAGNVQQAQSAADSANYSKYLQQALLEASQGSNANAIKNNLFNAVRSGQLGIDSLYAILQQLGAA